MSENGTLNILIRELGSTFLPLNEALRSLDDFKSFMRQLGWQVDNVPEPIANLGGSISTLISIIDKVHEKIATENDYQEGLKAIKRLNESIQGLESSTYDANLTAANFAEIFPKQLIDYLLANYLITVRPSIGFALKALGILNTEFVNASELHPAHKRISFKWGNIEKVIEDPLVVFKNVYNWGQNDLKSLEILETLLSYFRAIGISAFLEEIDDFTAMSLIGDDQEGIVLYGINIPFFDSSSSNGLANAGVVIMELPNSGGKLPGFILIPYVNGELERDFRVNDYIIFDFTTDLIITGGIGLKLRPDTGLELIKGFNDVDVAQTAKGSIELSLKIAKDSAQPIILLGEDEGSRLQMKSLSGKGGIIVDASDELDLYTELNLDDLELIISGDDGDGFLQKILPEDGISASLDLSLGYSTKRGVYFRGSGGLEIIIPSHIEFGPLVIQSLVIGVLPKDGRLPINIGANINANIGPIRVIVENIGILATFSFPELGGGNLGPLNLDIGFKPPNGVGLSIDAGAVKGGGYLFFDYDREEYGGALELVFSEWIALKAIGLITTKMPDGSKGFSMIIIITVEFGTGIQLGFGFTLLGVGGILGLNRSVNIDPLKEGIRTGAADRIMFPEDVVANAPRIISDLRTFFPTTADAFLVGPMARIGYGTPTLLSLSLGVIIEFPDVYITILGVLKVVLPDEEADVLRLQVNFIGRIEPSNKLLWFYAELFDSRILFITIEGGMGLLVNWGEESNFVVSIGGFHPRYTPPPLPFPSPPRVAVNILNESMARVRIEGYFAVTSNTAQFGARAELFFGFSAVNVEGHLSFDALFQFDPFYFIFEFSVGLSVKVFGFGLFSISISGMLEGPSKWHIQGQAKWKITWLGPTIKINIDETWGEERQTELPPIEILPLIEKEYEAITNWEALMPEGRSMLVALRKLGEEQPPSEETAETELSPLVLHPMGKLKISQRKLPLNMDLDKLGNQKPGDVNRIFITASVNGGGNLTTENFKEQFAPGEFLEIDKAERLSSPGFEWYDGGKTLQTKGSQQKTSMAVKRVIRYETVILDNNYKRYSIPFFDNILGIYAILENALFGHFLKNNSVSKSTLSKSYKTNINPSPVGIKVQPQGFSVANIADNKPIKDEAGLPMTNFSSWASARDYLNRQTKHNPNLASEIHVVPNTEINDAA
ncbi:hypothetical protein E7Z59_11605 [Robertkochia marina]|uniref:DUF6603 domain-containing protein n=1 Tax=Robertkochia marina TaxID=1227945 RepID=A0A4S3LYS2_9FLAO|nr:DUF6603 domain-containing protein [Robertkochia marina]THD66445.1 hypothetical protein E7Z59_11605 [Robertkochia marina]TRZ44122.1 hypothetical protein D3A96_09415 [Robertkochia marina]